MISRNSSPPISLYLSVLLFNLPLNPPFCLKNASLLYLRTRTHHWPRISELLMLPILKEHLATPRRRGVTLRRTRGYCTLPLLVRCIVAPPRCCKGLRHSVECFAATYLRLLHHFSFYSLLRSFLLLVSFFFYSYITVPYKTL